MIIGSVQWLEIQRSGYFDRRPPVPYSPPAKPKAKPTMPPANHYLNGKRCHWCDREMIAGTMTHPTRDHVVPKSKGGRATVLACYQCNHLKGDMMPLQWIAYMEEYPDWWQHRLVKPPCPMSHPPMPDLPRPRRVHVASNKPCPVLSMVAYELAQARHEEHLRQKKANKAARGTLARMERSGQMPLPRGATLPPPDAPPPPLAFEHSADRPARRMTALETAVWLRESAERKGQPWPLA